ncbi:hypothetical protein LSUE1_G005313 [Lachnellula suecica]|uniref:Uncharacterized protein n=1 Tax=Lachnellula suecica TaxID=602035 RepID=A0A8T9C8K1_9HELO|nr:hypothetical protein LSUE1_G005313 [Lachnellula suecica]
MYPHSTSSDHRRSASNRAPSSRTTERSSGTLYSPAPRDRPSQAIQSQLYAHIPQYLSPNPQSVMRPIDNYASSQSNLSLAPIAYTNERVRYSAQVRPHGDHTSSGPVQTQMQPIDNRTPSHTTLPGTPPPPYTPSEIPISAENRLNRMASRQLQIESLPAYEREEQETWAQEQLQSNPGSCIAGRPWTKEQRGYRCSAGGHY